MSPDDDKLVRIVGPMIFGAAALLATAGAVNAVTVMVKTGPGVGDIITFATSADVPLVAESRLLVHREDQFACVLDLNTIRKGGGSLIVEARMPGESRAFRLHWAGEKTSADNADCGHTADLIVDHSDIDVIAMAAGGYGVSQKIPATVNNTLPF